MSTSTRNIEKNAASNFKKYNKKGPEVGKPPLCVDPQKKSIYPDAMSYKHGTANSKIIQLREHLTKSNTVSNPDLLKEEQAIIDSMFTEKGRQASKERENYPLSIYLGAHQRRKKRGTTKPLHPINERGVSSAAGQKKQREHSLNTNALRSEHSKNLLKVEGKFFTLILVYIDRQPSRQESYNRNAKSKNKRKKKNTKDSQINKKFEYFSLLAKHNVESRKNIGTTSSAFGSRKESNSVREGDVSVSYASKENKTEPQLENKDFSEITALERLSYMNACARMELLNANSKLLNFQINRDSK